MMMPPPHGSEQVLQVWDHDDNDADEFLGRVVLQGAGAEGLRATLLPLVPPPHTRIGRFLI